jgi:hypothetical protein
MSIMDFLRYFSLKHTCPKKIRNFIFACNYNIFNQFMWFLKLLLNFQGKQSSHSYL